MLLPFVYCVLLQPPFFGVVFKVSMMCAWRPFLLLLWKLPLSPSYQVLILHSRFEGFRLWFLCHECLFCDTWTRLSRP